jgi:hypothetical protein
MSHTSLSQWGNLGTVDPRNLANARLQLHWATQLISALPDAAFDRLPDDSQSNLGWVDELGALLSRPLPGGRAAGLLPGSLELLVVDDSGGQVDRLELAGRTLDEGLSWLSTVTALGDSEPHPALRDYDMPDHPVASGQPFAIDNGAAFAEITRWIAIGHATLDGLRSSHAGWSDVRLWPHHFDLGTIVTLEASGDPSQGRSIGAGMSLGDMWYAEPYFYVNPYGLDSRPDVMPELPQPAHWHTESWFGAAVTATALLNQGDPASRASALLEESVEISRGLLAT